jgi:hypothetical protein
MSLTRRMLALVYLLLTQLSEKGSSTLNDKTTLLSSVIYINFILLHHLYSPEMVDAGWTFERSAIAFSTWGSVLKGYCKSAIENVPIEPFPISYQRRTIHPEQMRPNSSSSLESSASIRYLGSTPTSRVLGCQVAVLPVFHLACSCFRHNPK